MRPTEFVYSSHDRCEYIHRDWLVERALEHPHDKSLLYLPCSSGTRQSQEYSYGTFSWYLDRFRHYGLEPRTFYWDDNLRPEDARLLFDWLRHSRVVILGGGRISLGMDRYRALGERAFGDPETFVRTLWARQAAGLLTAGFSAGAAQLCEHSCDEDIPTFGMVAKTVVTLHHEPAARGHLDFLAHRHPDCLVFGLPNDSGLAIERGFTQKGNYWQIIQFVIDCSWDRPEDAHHIKTRQGVQIEHRYLDGREWRFNGGDILLRVFYRGDGWEGWIKRPEVGVFHEYGTQRECGYRCVEEILGSR